MTLKCFALIFTFLFSAFNQDIVAQHKSDNVLQQKAELVQSGRHGGSELASLYIDMLRNAMQKYPNSKGVFVIYCGKICKYGEVESHLRGLNLSLKGKGWKPTDYSVLTGGYKENLTVEYWAVPQNACLPVPSSEVNIKDVKFSGTYKGKFVPYDCCEY